MGTIFWIIKRVILSILSITLLNVFFHNAIPYNLITIGFISIFDISGIVIVLFLIFFILQK